jgi:hypothetical protein
MARVSVASIRATNPHIAIIVACDGESYTAMKHSRDPLLEEVDDLIVCNTPAGDSLFRSRFVKTQLRRLVDGPFLFLDNDTFVRDDISEIFSLDADIACAPNNSKDSIEQQRWCGDDAILSRMGWRIRQDVYVNGGVIFYNNTPDAARIGDDWHQKWLRSYAIAKSYKDQPALNAAIFDIAPRLQILPHRFNAQFKVLPSTVSSAVLWHFYATREDEPLTEVELLVGKLLKGAELRRSHIESIVRRSHPWRRDSWVDDFVARRVIKKGVFDQRDQLWFQGHRMRSVAGRAIRLMIRLFVGRTMYDRLKRMAAARSA